MSAKFSKGGGGAGPFLARSLIVKQSDNFRTMFPFTSFFQNFVKVQTVVFKKCTVKNHLIFTGHAFMIEL